MEPNDVGQVAVFGRFRIVGPDGIVDTLFADLTVEALVAGGVRL